jgi:RHS repeat-associated protein
LHADERGSIIAVSNASGAVTNVNSYDEYGVPAAGNAGRFQYTGQAWLTELGMYHYKARTYSPTVGRFMQPDPIKYHAGPNLYNYVRSDPVNLNDPSGLQEVCWTQGGGSYIDKKGNHIVKAGARFCFDLGGIPTNIFAPGASDGASGGGDNGDSTAAPPLTQTPTTCQKAFLKAQLGSRGLPTHQIDNLKFVSGLDANANWFSQQALARGARAVTQGSTVYVQPNGFETVVNFRSATGFEEAYHTAQFASDPAFYTSYALSSLGGVLSTGDKYNGNFYEAFAKGAARHMFEASKFGMCR